MRSTAVRHAALARLNRARLAPTLDTPPDLDGEFALRRIEEEFLEAERAGVASRAAAAPAEPAAFVAWFEGLRETGPGQGTPLFDWLATGADEAQMRWFLRQEVAVERGFEDHVALTQIRMPTRAKLELARNYWEEMGRGREPAMHRPMLDRLAEALELDLEAPVCWEALAVANLMTGLAANRAHAFRSIGALGVVELTAPGRAARVNAGLARLGHPGATRMYYALHATIDARHAEAWNREVIAPLVAEDPRRARPIAEGALMRLQAGARAFGAYHRAFTAPMTGLAA